MMQKMFETEVNRNVKFYNTFVDLKVVGWKTYSAALNEYTNGVFETNLHAYDEAVETFADQMKEIITPGRGMCK